MFVGRHTIFLEKEFIQEGGSGKTIELEKVQDLWSIQKQHVESPQVDPQSDVSIIEAQQQHTLPLRRSNKVHNVLLRYGFVI